PTKRANKNKPYRSRASKLMKPNIQNNPLTTSLYISAKAISSSFYFPHGVMINDIKYYCAKLVELGVLESWEIHYKRIKTVGIVFPTDDYTDLTSIICLGYATSDSDIRK